MNTLAPFLMLVGLFGGPTGLTLRGVVTDVDGKPIAEARVDIATAAPRFGPRLFCPSCYRDCGKSTTTDEQGRFEISGLDPGLLFTALASAPNKKASHSPLVDPISGDLKIVLEALPTGFPRERMIEARIEDDRGAPLAGALVTPVMVQVTERTARGGNINFIPSTGSDLNGCFALYLPEAYLSMQVEIAARGYAGARVALPKPGAPRARLVVPTGTRVVGRLVHLDRPQVGVRVSVVQMDRDARHFFIKAVGAITNTDGKFVFDHLPADEDYAIFTLVGEGPQKLVLTTKKFKAYGNHQERNLGDLELIPALRIAGRVDFPAGQPALPPDARITVGRAPAWDLIAIPIRTDGSFVIDGLAPESIQLNVVAKGFKLDANNVPYQILNEEGFGLRLRESLTDLRIPLVRSDK